MSKNLYLMQFYEINISQVMIFRLYNVYNKRKIVKIGNLTRKKSQVLSQSARIILLPTVILTEIDATSFSCSNENRAQ